MTQDEKYAEMAKEHERDMELADSRRPTKCSNGTSIALGGCFGHCPKCKLRFAGSLCWGPNCACPEMAPLDVEKLMLLIQHNINPEDAAKTLIGEETSWTNKST